MSGLVAIFICLLITRNAVVQAATSRIVGSPTVTLPSGGVLTGNTILYREPDFMVITKNIDAYLGIPFAEPPLEELRFAYPVPHEIQGSYNATRDRDMCPQVKLFDDLPPFMPDIGKETSEDCLYLSVYTPSPKPSTPTPVMVWIHGGAYSVGGGSGDIYEPLPLVALSDIVYVSINYRLGVLGFLTTGDDVAKGNFGLMDQLVALQWVRDNIAVFGGDPGRVTIAGESAGGGSVSQHMLSPLSSGLFHQAIMESGNAICPWASNPLEVATFHNRAFAEICGCPSSDSREMVDCMRTLDAEYLVQKQEEEQSEHGPITFPVIDGYFLLDNSMEMVKRRQFQVIPTLMGTNRDEMAWRPIFFDWPGAIFQPPVVNISYFRYAVQEYSFYASTPPEFAAIDQQYIDWSIADNPSADQRDAYVRYDTDQSFACPTEYFARALEAAGADVYRYEMTHSPAWSIYLGVPTWTGPMHAEELQFVFAWDLNPSLENVVDQTDEEKMMSIEFMRYWTNFVRSGNPNNPISSFKYPAWPKYTRPEQEYKILSLNMTNDRAMRAADCAFWINTYPNLRIQTAPMEELYTNWQKQYKRWRDSDMVDWVGEFEKYQEENGCPTPSP